MRRIAVLFVLAVAACGGGDEAQDPGCAAWSDLRPAASSNAVRAIADEFESEDMQVEVAAFADILERGGDGDLNRQAIADYCA